MRKIVLSFFLIFFILPKLKALPSYSANYFTLYNNENDYSYGLSESFNFTLDSEYFSFNNINLLGNYKNLYIPFEDFTLNSSSLNFYSSFLSSEFSFCDIKAGIKLFAPFLLDNSFSACLFDFNLQLENAFGSGLFLKLYDDLAFSFNYFFCDAKMLQYEAEGKLKAFLADGEYCLHTSFFDSSFWAFYLYSTGTYNFDLSIPLIQYKLYGDGKLELSALGTGAKVETSWQTINLKADLAFIYLFSGNINTDVYQKKIFLFFLEKTSQDTFVKDFSQTLIIPFSFSCIFDADFSKMHIKSSLSKTLAIPISFNKSFNIFTGDSDEAKSDRFYSIFRTLLLSGINLNFTIYF